jgi:Saxitoxin biosynthesis operon protein SxtJ
LWPLLDGIPVRNWALGLGIAFFALAIFRPGTLTRLNRAWMRFGLLLNRIVSPLAVGVVYYLGLVPTALLMRIFGKQPLSLRFDSDAKSYWIPRKPAGPDPKTMLDQF